MNCLICRQAELVEGSTSIIFERGEVKLVVNRVPGLICPKCGEAYVEGDVAVKLRRGADKISMTGELNAVREYDLL